MKTKNIIFILLGSMLISLGNSTANMAQPPKETTGPEIGEKFPSYEFLELENSEKTKVDGGTYKGKWMVIDFWSEWCGACIKSMPKMSKMQQQFKDRVKIIMVGTYAKTDHSSVKTMRKIYNNMVNSFGVNLTIAYDNILGPKLNVERLPDVFVIDPDGILRARISNLTPEFLDALINHKEKELGLDINSTMNTRNSNKIYDQNVPLLVNGNGGSEMDFIFRSLIVPHSDLTRSAASIFKPGQMELIDYSLAAFYKFAIWGDAYWNMNDKDLYENKYLNPILNIADSSDFYNAAKLEKTYSYSFWYPKNHAVAAGNKYDPKDNEKMRSRILFELKSCFGYEVKTEVRMMPCYRLTKGKNYKSIVSSGGNSKFERPKGSWGGVKIVNYPFRRVIDYIYMAYKGNLGYDPSMPIIDETGISENVDFEFWGNTFSEAKNDLEKRGLILKLDKKEMECIVITDSPK